MTRPPEFEIDPKTFWEDPYPDLARLRAAAPVAYVPQLDAVLITRRDDISEQEKKTEVFASEQPGGQNEPRDAIAGTAWALLTHPEQLADVQAGRAAWLQAFEEYARWISPIGMSPRRVARDHKLHGVTIAEGARAFLMFGSGNRDERVFAKPDHFDIHQDSSAAISFGAGPHFCAGAWAAKALIAEVALPLLFARLPGLRLAGAVPFGGWAFRGPLNMPVAWG